MNTDSLSTGLNSIARRILGAEFPEVLIETYDDELEVKDEADWQLNWNSRFEYLF